jgi:hypothetical protein
MQCEDLGLPAVAKAVAFNFFLPPIAVRFWTLEMKAASVPKAAVNKNAHPLLREDQVGCTAYF